MTPFIAGTITSLVSQAGGFLLCYWLYYRTEKAKATNLQNQVRNLELQLKRHEEGSAYGTESQASLAS